MEVVEQVALPIFMSDSQLGLKTPGLFRALQHLTHCKPLTQTIALMLAGNMAPGWGKTKSERKTKNGL